MQRRPEKISSLEVDRGLYVIRYTGAPGNEPPVMFVRPSPGSDGLITVVGYPGDEVGRLASPGSLAILVVDAPATVQITAQASSAGGSLDAELQLEPVRRTESRVAVAKPEPVASGAPSLGREFAGIAHVSRIGDVELVDSLWIGGPDAPAPIEALGLRCAPQAGSVHYQVLVSGAARWSEWLSDGALGGSRGRARPLTGVRIRFAPASGSEATLDGEALFLGSALVRKEGPELEFVSSAGVDPLVGIKLGLKRRLPQSIARPGIAAASSPSGRVRVFKASSSRRAG